MVTQFFEIVSIIKHFFVSDFTKQNKNRIRFFQSSNSDENDDCIEKNENHWGENRKQI